MPEKRTVLVTGSEGFIGSHLVKSLKKKYRVIRFDLKREQDIRSEQMVRVGFGDKFTKVWAVIHLAALKSVPFSFLEPYEVMQTNAVGTMRLLEEARKRGVKKFVYISSSSVYGGGLADVPISEDTRPNPLSPYAISKLAGEYYAMMYRRLYNMDITSLRFFNVFGPGCENVKGYGAVIPRWIKAMIEGKRIELYGDGETTRDFTYVDDVVSGIERVLEVKEWHCNPAIYNIAKGESISLKSLLSSLQRITGNQVRIKRLPEREGDVRHSCADISKAKLHLGYESNVSLESGLKKMVEYMEASELLKGDKLFI